MGDFVTVSEADPPLPASPLDIVDASTLAALEAEIRAILDRSRRRTRARLESFFEDEVGEECKDTPSEEDDMRFMAKAEELLFGRKPDAMTDTTGQECG